jgi:hypothetical protein
MSLGRKPLERCIKWRPPDFGFSKLNFDGSVVKGRSAATGFVIQDQVVISLLALEEFQQTMSLLQKLLPFGKTFALPFIEIFVKFKLRVTRSL